MLTSQQALERLREGNLRFASDVSIHHKLATETRRRELVAGQQPFAVILGCADSRAPAEIVFDQGLGDLFVIRVAGNIVAPSLIGSVEFAVERFGTPLVTVLGHTNCGAVTATLSELEHPTEGRSPNLLSIVDRIRPAVEPLLHSEPPLSPNVLLQQAVRSNISASAKLLRQGSPILDELIDRGELLVVGAEYSLETGEVDFFDGLVQTVQKSTRL